MSDTRKILFISGANRGIGYGLSQLVAERNYLVIAGYRTEQRSKRLLTDAEQTDSIVPFKVDVLVEKDLELLRDFIADRHGHLDVLVNNAGINVRPTEKISDLHWEDIEENLAVNLGGPFLTSKYLYPLLRMASGAKIINISSSMGSIETSSGGSTPYRISKAGLNMLTKNQAVEYRSNGVAVVSVHPGWVRTDMGGRSAPLTVEASAKKILMVIEQVSLENTGQFLSPEGKVLPY